MQTLRIEAAAWEVMLAHARSVAPNECCGLLLGADDLVDECAPARNVLASPTRYMVDPADHFAAIRRARGTGRRVIGAYHSHPRSPAVPSPSDVAEANDPDLLCVIVSLAGGVDVRGYKLDGEQLVSVPLVMVSSRP